MDLDGFREGGKSDDFARHVSVSPISFSVIVIALESIAPGVFQFSGGTTPLMTLFSAAKQTRTMAFLVECCRWRSGSPHLRLHPTAQPALEAKHPSRGSQSLIPLRDPGLFRASPSHVIRAIHSAIRYPTPEHRRPGAMHPPDRHRTPVSRSHNIPLIPRTRCPAESGLRTSRAPSLTLRRNLLRARSPLRPLPSTFHPRPIP